MADAPKFNQPSAGDLPEEDAVERRTLRDYYIIIRERVRIALPIAVLVAAGLGYYQARETPMYETRAKMEFEKPETVVTTQGVVDPYIRGEADLNTALINLESQNLRTRVAESLTPEQVKILQRPALKHQAAGHPESSPPTAENSLGKVLIEPSRNSYIISVIVRHEEPEAAAIVANAYITQYMRSVMENLGGKNDDAIGFLRERARELEKESKTDEEKLQAYMKEHQLVSLDKSLDMVSSGLVAINTNLQASRLTLLNLDDLVKQVEAYKKENKNLLEISYIANHASVPTLRIQLAEFQQKQALLSERYLELHPKFVDAVNEAAIAQSRFDRAVQTAVTDLYAAQAAARQSVKSLQDEYATQEQQALRLRELSVDFSTLQNKASVSKSNYLAILDRLNQTTTTKILEKVPLHIVERAAIPSAPYSPNIPRIVRSSVGLGIALFLGIALSLGFLDDRVKSAWDIESFIGANLLGIIPTLNSVKEDERHTLVLEGSQAPGVEAFLSVYSAAKISSKLDFPKSILITSTIPGEGKTLVSCNFSGSFARHGKRTLLIDCDLRRPMLHRHFKQPNTSGLISWFEAGASLEADPTRDPQLGISKVGENLWLLTSGGRSKSPTELLENPVFGELLERLKKHFDLVVIDSPPMGAVTDSRLIAERVDEVIYVCRFNHAYRKHIKLFIKALQHGKNDVLGIVLNGLSPRRIEYYSNYRYYRSYKKYYGAQT